MASVVDLSVLDSVAAELQSDKIQLHAGRSLPVALKSKVTINSVASITPTAKPRPSSISSPQQKPAQQKWHEIKPIELTSELKKDLKLLQMRDTLDPKRFYKKGTLSNLLNSNNDKNSKTVAIQIGTIVDDPLYRFNRLTNKERKGTIAQQVLADKQTTDYFKGKVNKIAEQRLKTHGKGWKAVRSKRLKLMSIQKKKRK